MFGSTVFIVPIFGFPLTVFNYSSQVFPPLLMAAVLGPLYKLLRKIIPANLQLIFVPFFAMLIMIPLTAFIIGPIGVYAGAALAQGLAAINQWSPFIFAIVIPLAYPFMVPLGLHWPINAVMLLNINTLGYDFIQGPMGAWNFACFGATAGVLVLSLRHRDPQMRQTATGALAAGLLGGISEPSLYGIHLRFKRIYPRMLVGCFVGGLIIGIGSLSWAANGVTTKAFVFTSLLTIPAFSPIGLYAIAIAGGVLHGDVPRDPVELPHARAAGGVRGGARRRRGRRRRGARSAPRSRRPSAGALDASDAAAGRGSGGDGDRRVLERVAIEIASPLEGTVVPLSDVPDPVFSGGSHGSGCRRSMPTGDTVYSPGAGIVAPAQPTGHAFGLVLDGGIEVLIHVGIDTVNLKGEGFDVKVKNGDRVEVGTPLVTFDRKVIEDAGYPLVTPVIVLNGKKFASVEPAASGEVSAGSPILAVQAQVAPANV